MTRARRTFVISDLHLGGDHPDPSVEHDRGFRLCTHPDRLARFIESLSAMVPADTDLELVINGDIVDFLAESEGSPPAWTPFERDGAKAAATLQKMVARTGDREVFAALGRFLDRGHRLVLLLGNHDVELALPAVREALHRALGITGRHDFQFIFDGEAYVVGHAALIEHGNRYDAWNTVDHHSLRELRAWQTRRQPDRRTRFDVNAGARMVCDIINPIKASYRFVDLLKPETGAVLPLLLALEPGIRRVLPEILGLRATVRRHRLDGAAQPRLPGDIAAIGTQADPYGGDPYTMAGSPGDDSGRDDAVWVVLEDIMPGQAGQFLASLDDAPRGAETLGDIASMSPSFDRACGMARLLARRGDASIERRLPALLQSLRVLQNDRTFRRDTETFPEYLDAATELTRGGFDFVLFGHTHLARDIPIARGARYLNTGAWTDRIRFPHDMLSGPERQALDALRAFVTDMADGRLSAWLEFAPTCVRVDTDDSGRAVAAELFDC